MNVIQVGKLEDKEIVKGTDIKEDFEQLRQTAHKMVRILQICGIPYNHHCLCLLYNHHCLYLIIIMCG